MLDHDVLGKTFLGLARFAAFLAKEGPRSFIGLHHSLLRVALTGIVGIRVPATALIVGGVSRLHVRVHAITHEKVSVAEWFVRVRRFVLAIEQVVMLNLVLSQLLASRAVIVSETLAADRANKVLCKLHSFKQISYWLIIN